METYLRANALTIALLLTSGAGAVETHQFGRRQARAPGPILFAPMKTSATKTTEAPASFSRSRYPRSDALGHLEWPEDRNRGAAHGEDIAPWLARFRRPTAKAAQPGRIARAKGPVTDVCSRICPAQEITCGDLLDGSLTEDDCVLSAGIIASMPFFDHWRFEIDEAQEVNILMTSADFDAVLLLAAPNGNQCTIFESNNNDPLTPGSSDSRLRVGLIPGVYYIIATSLDGAAGAYQLGLDYVFSDGCGPNVVCQSECRVVEPLECNSTSAGSLAAGDCQLGGTAFEVWSLEIPTNREVEFRLEADFDPFAILLDDNCLILEVEAGAAGDAVSLRQNLVAGSYFLVVNAALPGQAGDYVLDVLCDDITFCQERCRRGEVSCGDTISGLLEAGDCLLPGGEFTESWSFELEESQRISIDLTSPDFDTFLWLLDADDDCAIVGTNDDAPSSTDSRLIGDLPPGNYTIAVDTFAPGATGEYDLSVACEPAPFCVESCQAGAVACGESASASLDPGDCTLPEDGSLFDVWSFRVDERSEIEVRVSSTDFEPFVLLTDSDCIVFAQNRSTDGSETVLRGPLEAGDYRIVANSFDPLESGAYTVQLTCTPLAPAEVFLRGDTDGNGNLEVTDPINNLSFQFLGTFTPPCRDAADFDDNGKVEITDPIANLSHQFLGQGAPPAPGKDTCGADPTTDDDLDCEAYPPESCP